MRTHSKRFRDAVAGVTTLAVVAAGLTLAAATPANALPPGTAAAGTAATSVASGTSATNFQLTLATNTVNVSTIGLAATVVTVATATPHGLLAAQSFTLTLAPVIAAIPNGTYTVVSVPNATTLTFTGGAGSVASGAATGTVRPLPYCPGDGPAGYRWHTFITPIANDPAPMTYSASGTPSGPAFTNNLRDTGGTQVRAQNPGLSTGDVTPAQTLNFASVSLAGLTPAVGVSVQYTVGIACTLTVSAIVETQKFWSTPFTITGVAGAGPNNFNWALGIVPTAPVLTSVTPGDTTLAAAFTSTASTPVTTSFTATADPGTPGVPGDDISASGGASPISIPGLTNGTLYTVTVKANNTVGASAASNSLSGTPAAPPRPPVATLTSAPGTGACTVNWTAPASGPTPTGYSITVTPGAFGPFSVSNATFTQYVPSMNPGTVYTFTVTPTHGTPPAATGANVQCTPNAAQIILQQITVVRPAGALILTQRCGVYGALPSFSPALNFPGFPRSLGVAAAVGGSGSAPFTVWSDPLNSGSVPDPEFGNYPNPSPATYPTHCALSMGTGSLITNGVDPATAGRYYTATGRLNQVTVLDTRDIDQGWTVSASQENFSSGTDSFDGDYLGWVPVMTDDSDASGGYDQTVTAGSAVLPGTGVTSGTGLGTSAVLASALAGFGLGEALLDARVNLLIPTTANAGTYTGTLSLTVI